MRRSTRALVVAALAVVATSNAELNSTEDDTFGRDSLLSILDALPASASEECSSASAEVAFERANRLKSNRQLYGALGCYHRAITVDPNHASTYNNLANTIKRLDVGAINCGNKPCERDELTSAAIRRHAPCLRLRYLAHEHNTWRPPQGGFPVFPSVEAMRNVVPAAALFLALAWPSRAVKSSGKSNGKSFRRSGAWVLSKEYMAQARCNQSGIPAIECAYKLDERLATCLAQLFRGRSVTELGAGVGRYKRFIEGTGLAGECWPASSAHPQPDP